MPQVSTEIYMSSTDSGASLSHAAATPILRVRWVNTQNQRNCASPPLPRLLALPGQNFKGVTVDPNRKHRFCSTQDCRRVVPGSEHNNLTMFCRARNCGQAIKQDARRFLARSKHFACMNVSTEHPSDRRMGGTAGRFRTSKGDALGIDARKGFVHNRDWANVHNAWRRRDNVLIIDNSSASHNRVAMRHDVEQPGACRVVRQR